MHKIKEVLEEKYKGNNFLKVTLYVSGKVRLINRTSFILHPLGYIDKLVKSLGKNLL